MKFNHLLILLLIVNFQLNSQTFVEASGEAGVDHLFRQNQQMGGGAVFFDYDNDGWEDLYIVSGRTEDHLYKNDRKGGFVRVNNVGLEVTSSFYTTGAVSADFNNDGFRDLLVTTWRTSNNSGGMQRNLLFINNGNGSFTEKGESSGIIEKAFSMGASVFDYNQDGHLDIYIINHILKSQSSIDSNGNTVFEHDCFANFFYENNGDGTFTEKATQLKLNNTGCGLAVMPTDFDQDNDQDLYLANDFGKDILPNAIYRNNFPSPTFTDVSATSQANQGIFAMGIAYADIDKDNDWDYYITNIGRNVLLENNGSQVFSDITTTASVENTYTLDAGNKLTTSWGTAFLDVNNDTWPDLFVANGLVTASGQIETGETDPNKLYLNNGDKTFSDITGTAGVGNTNRSRGMAYADYDRDGDLDIIVVVQDESAGSSPKTLLYKNQLNPNSSNGNNWVQFNLEGVTINKDAIGAKIKLTVNGEELIQEVHGQGSHCSQHSLNLHFGLANSVVIDKVDIIWSSSVTQTFNNVAANKLYNLKEGETIGNNDIAGCTDPNSCNYNPIATIDNGSCEYLEPKEIIGNKESGFNIEEAYTYSKADGSNVVWQVEGGALVSGQGTRSITVKWSLNEKGKITVSESLNNCLNVKAELEVDLNVTRVAENVSVARLWNEALLEAIRHDYARPTVHARNLFHTAIALYDAWAIYDSGAKPYLIGNDVHEFKSILEPFKPQESIELSKKKALSYAAYKLLTHRFKNSPGTSESLKRFDLLMNQLGYDASYTTSNYQSGNAADLGNYIAQTIIAYGLEDNSRETSDYDNSFYEPVNSPIILNPSGLATGIVNPNRWQPLTFNTFIDQSGNLIPGSTPEFLSPEWGVVTPFALSESSKQVFRRNNNNYTVYHAPEQPPTLNVTNSDSSSNLYKWNFSLVSLWSSHLDPSDGVMWDISPKKIGNIDIDLFPTRYDNHVNFYDEINGGDISKGHAQNPVTGLPYETQIVPRADYARALAEFWADGPDSETPPGHWFTILNYVSDHELFERKFKGEGSVLTPLEWDVKSYFILGGAMHDAAITAWGIKGWYDYIRPISAIRYMCELGQSSDENLPNYHKGGIELKPGFIEIIKENDVLRGDNNENVGKIKLYAWRGHDFINDATTDVAGVGWVLAKNWWPYQRPSFVTPPFAGFVSGHSTFSRAAAEVMTLMTGDEFFPGGMGEFVAKKDEFLVFEKGPSVDVKLQWATYRDASDQTSLSRIWGGIHPPADDIPGRIIGEQVGIDAYQFALSYFKPSEEIIGSNTKVIVYPNPTNDELFVKNITEESIVKIYSLDGRLIQNGIIKPGSQKLTIKHLPNGIYVISINNNETIHNQLIVKK